ncbi:MAG TPA: glycosyltransferase, partial [Cytophagales bacterium]|nr:glycosyltransferase [Cytophagales bacterium]
KWAGFTRIGEKVVEHRERKYGITKFGWERFVKGFLDLLSIMFVGKFRRNPMHFFGSLGIVSFLFGFIFTGKIFYDKIDSLFISQIPLKRDITDQPIFYLALVAVVIGVQLFLTGYLAEMVAMQSLSKRDYLIIEKVGLKELIHSQQSPLSVTP